MKNKIKTFILFVFTLVFVGLFALIHSYDPIKGQVLNANKNSAQILGAKINVRGEIPEKTTQINKLPELNLNKLKEVRAKSYIVFDIKTGEILAEKNSDVKLPIASLTKLMTGYVVYKSLDFSAKASITPKNYWEVSPKLGFEFEDEVKIHDLFNAMIIGSANDAAFALANIFEDKTNNDFVKIMNLEAESLGLLSTSFSNPAGFDSISNFSTARDLKILVSTIFKLPAFKNLAKKTYYNFSGESGKIYKISATNKLISKYPDLFAVKTGYTKNALGSMATVIENLKNEIAIIVLDSTQRETDTLIIREALINPFKSQATGFVGPILNLNFGFKQVYGKIEESF